MKERKNEERERERILRRDGDDDTDGIGSARPAGKEGMNESVKPRDGDYTWPPAGTGYGG